MRFQSLDWKDALEKEMSHECVDYSFPLLTLCFLPQNNSISSIPLSSQSNSVNLCGCLSR